MSKPRVLLVNDDGPPSKTSPYVLPLFDALVELGWSVRVVLPSGQRSWSGTLYSVSQPQVRYWYYYPIRGNFDGQHPDTHLCWSDKRRPICQERGEYAEWILADASPSSCANVGIFTSDALLGCRDGRPIDSVISGPNFGRNTGTAFAVSSGTLGGALAGALTGRRSFALSFGHFTANPPCFESRSDAPALTSDELAEARRLANIHATDLIQQLWDSWEKDPDTSVYSINIPLCETLRCPSVRWTHLWDSEHSQLYHVPSDPVPKGGTHPPFGMADFDRSREKHNHSYLNFVPDLSKAMRPASDDALDPKTDVGAVCLGQISITRIRATYAQLGDPSLPAPQCTHRYD